jgi:hypothetical protein
MNIKTEAIRGILKDIRNRQIDGMMNSKDRKDYECFSEGVAKTNMVMRKIRTTDCPDEAMCMIYDENEALAGIVQETGIKLGIFDKEI